MASRPVPPRWSDPPFRREPLPVSADDREACDAEIAALKARWADLRRQPWRYGQSSEAPNLQTLALDLAAARFEESQMQMVGELLRPGELTRRQVGDCLAPFITAALDRADAEGVIWNPLLDQLSITFWFAQVQQPLARLRRLGPWIGSQSTQDGLLTLRSFRSPVMARTLAANIPGALLSTSWLDWFLRHEDEKVPKSLWENKAMAETAGCQEAMVEHAVSLLCGTEGGRLHTDIAMFLQQSVFQQPVLQQPVFRQPVLPGIGHLSEAQVTRLIHASVDMTGRSQAATREAARSIDSVLLRNPTTPDHVVEMIAVRSAETETPRLVAQHPNAPLYRLRRMAMIGSQHWGDIAQNPQAFRDPDIRERMSKSISLPVLQAFVEHSPLPDVPKRFERLLSRYPSVALDMLAEGAVPQGAAIDPMLLTPFLQSPDGAVRMKAITGIRVLGGGEMGTEGDGQGTEVPAVGLPVQRRRYATKKRRRYWGGGR